VKAFSKIAAVLLLLVAVAVAQETRPDEQTRVYQEGGRWSRQITGSMPAAKNLRVKVDSGSVRVEGGSQQNIGYSISNHSSASSEEKARREFEAYKISVYLRGDTAWVVGEWQGGRPRRSSSEFVINVPRNIELVKVATEGGDLVATGVAGRVETESGGGSIRLDDIGGVISAETGGGSIDVGTVGGELTLRTGGGSIKVPDLTTLPAPVLAVVRDVYGTATSDLFLVAAPIAFLAVLAVAFIKEKPLSTLTGDERRAREAAASPSDGSR